ncbi:MAG: DUF2336 domain-containing protein [Pseudobdellovibrionaceae bacterium]
MNLGVLSHSQKVAPLLVKLYDTHKLYQLAETRSPEARGALAQIVADLLYTELSLREKELVADVLVALIKQAEKDLRQAIAQRLALVDGVPSQVILHLAYDDIEVAEDVLRFSNGLEALDLLYIIESRDAPYWRAIAHRQNLSSQVSVALSDVNDTETHDILIHNNDVILPEDAIRKLSHHAEGNEELARPLLERPEMTKELASLLYLHVGQALRTYIEDHFAGVDPEITGTIAANVSDIVEEMAAPAPIVPIVSEFMPNANTQKAARNASERGQLTPQFMIEHLQRKQYKSFIALFAVYCGISCEKSLEILDQECGQGLAAVARSHRMERRDFLSLYLLTEIYRTEGAVTQAASMAKALAYYDKLEIPVAIKLMSELSEE